MPKYDMHLASCTDEYGKLVLEHGVLFILFKNCCCEYRTVTFRDVWSRIELCD